MSSRIFIYICALFMVAAPSALLAQTARLQVIHNAADPAAASVDVYINGLRALDDFAFRTATPFIDVPAGVQLSVAVAPGSSTSVADALATFDVTLASGGTYVAVANGVLAPASFAANPDGKPTAFTLLVKEAAREAAAGTGVDLMVLHGVTDAPTVDVMSRFRFYVAQEADYGSFSDYMTVPSSSYVLDVHPRGDLTTRIASYLADLSALEGSALVVFASGFLTPDANQSGAAFGLYAALPNGTVIALPEHSRLFPASLLMIHNAADPSAALVDVYINGELAIDDLAFRKAMRLEYLPSGEELAIAIAPATSTSVADALATFDVTLADGSFNVAVASGVLAPASFAANPDGKSTAFTLLFKEAARDTAAGSGVDLIVVHGATDAPTVDVVARGVGAVVDDAPYAAFTEYLNVPAASYILDVTPGNDNGTVVASYRADLIPHEGRAVVVFASGFLAPAANQNGPAFGLYAAFPWGAVVPLANITSTETIVTPSLTLAAYPQPASHATTVTVRGTVNGTADLLVQDLLGRTVHASRVDLRNGTHMQLLDTAQWPAGMYHMSLRGAGVSLARPLLVTR